MSDKFSKKNINCLLVQTLFPTHSFWNYKDVCSLIGAKYPAAPLGLITVAALLPQNWNFKLVDENLDSLSDEDLNWADLIVTGGMLPQQQRIIELINRAKEKNIPVAVGGPDPTSQPHLYEDANYLVLNEGEITIPQFLNDFENGIENGTYSTNDLADMTQSPVPRFDLLDFSGYLHVGIQFCRGCPFNCEFCDIIELYGRKPRTKNPEQIIAELQKLYDLGYRGHVDFVDDNFIGNKRNVKKVLPLIKEWSIKHKYPFYFSTEASINLADDEALLEMMKELDFKYVFIGIETPEDEILINTQKKQNVNKPLDETIAKIYQYGMAVNAGFIMGFDEETSSSADKMIHAIESAGISMAMLGLLYALPNTQLTRRLKKENRLFKEGNDLSEGENNVDQSTSGLNFLTNRPRVEILSDFAKVIHDIYLPDKYFKRVEYTCINLKPSNVHNPGLKRVLKLAKGFFRVCYRVGLNKDYGKYFWRTFFKVLFKNPSAIEAAVNISSMYIHFHKQSNFVLQLTKEKVDALNKFGEEKYNEMMTKTKSPEDKLPVS